MTGTTLASTWDFSPVFSLIHSLDTEGGTGLQPENERPSDGLPIPNTAGRQAAQAAVTGASPGLGNFDRLWDFLGVQRDAPSPTPAVPHFEVSLLGGAKAKDRDAYLSDGAVYYAASQQHQRHASWGDDTDAAGLTDVRPDVAGLTKNQRKKLYRKERRAAAPSAHHPPGGEDPITHTTIDTSDSAESFTAYPNSKLYKAKAAANGADIDGGGVHHRYPTRSKAAAAKRQAAAGAVGKHVAPKDAAKLGSSPPGRSDGKPTAADSIGRANKHALHFVRQDPSTPKSKHATSTPSAKDTKMAKMDIATPVATSTLGDRLEAYRQAREKVEAATRAAPSLLPHTPARPITAIHESLQKHYLVGAADRTRNQPAKQPLTPQAKISKPNGQQGPLLFPVIPTPAAHPAAAAAGRTRHEVLPLVNQTQIDRNWSLFLKCLHNFPADREHLVSPLQLSINRPAPGGIHVFVDASNIMIGFNEHLRRARGIPKYGRVPRVELNFHALALLLERRRPTAKRVLAGSTPEVAAFEEARQVGYETCILDKVYKAREMTERQRYFHARELGYASASDGAGGNASSEGSPKKWVEQAVDEVLHLKICESVIDTAVDAAGAARPTMVLATGDAAEAEYSPGFLRMVERALGKGWNVEVMAFGRSVSMGYRRMERLPMGAGGWGERFKIIELDDYVEELFGQSTSTVADAGA